MTPSYDKAATPGRNIASRADRLLEDGGPQVTPDISERALEDVIDCVRRLVNHARNHGPGERYLIQHPAGSGKSYTTAGSSRSIAQRRPPR